jgi:hypothetical protein
MNSIGNMQHIETYKRNNKVPSRKCNCIRSTLHSFLIILNLEVTKGREMQFLLIFKAGNEHEVTKKVA